MSSAPAQRGGIRLTARGAIAVVLVTTLVGDALSDFVDSAFVAGIAFVVGCLAAALLVNARDLLALVVTPPLLFFAASLIAETVRAFGADSMVQALGVGLFGALSGGAPWLFGGSALVLAVAWRRGLRDNVRELREELRGTRVSPEVPRPRVSEAAPAYAPEPEGYFEPRVYGRPRDRAE